MSDNDKLAMLESIMKVSSTDTGTIAILTTYLKSAEKEILQYKYSYAAEDAPTVVDPEDEMTQVWAVVAGYSIAGNEGQISGTEGAVQRQFRYPDMLHYIRSNVIPYAKVM